MKKSFSDTPRSYVIHISVKVEYFVNSILSRYLQIEPLNSKSFGTSSNALSLNAKVQLLLDLERLDKTYGPKFQKFMEIRNKFAHLNSVDSFESCFTLIKNSFNLLEEWYPTKTKLATPEENMRYAFIRLSEDLIGSLDKLFDDTVKVLAEKYFYNSVGKSFMTKREDYLTDNRSHQVALESYEAYLKKLMQDYFPEELTKPIPFKL